MRDREIVGLHQAYLDVYSNLNYNQDIVEVAEYLVAEGYADSYEEAEYIIEDMSDEEFELLNEARTQKPWSETKIERFNKEIKRQKKQRKKTPHSSLRPADQAALRRMLAGDPAPEPISNEPSPSPTRSASKPGQKPKITFADMSNSSDQGRRPRNLKAGMEYDTFDAILEHLVAEGYADTNESALAIMANMSEEWRQSIVEQQVPIHPAEDAFNKSTPEDRAANMKKYNTPYKPLDTSRSTGTGGAPAWMRGGFKSPDEYNKLDPKTKAMLD